MTDIVERLRQGIDPLDIPEAEQVMDKAADEIERLRECVFKSNEKFVEADDRVLELEASQADRPPIAEGNHMIMEPCPKCGTKLEQGYGLAGGGIGPYEYCPKEGCGYFIKFQDTEMEIPAEFSPRGAHMNVPAKADIIESVIVKGDLSKLTPDERVRYYNETCNSLGLNPLTQPFSYITLSGKLILYATRNCADQLRKINNVSLEIISRQVANNVLTVHCRARLPDGRTDEDFGRSIILKLCKARREQTPK